MTGSMIDQPAQDGGTFFTAPVCDRDHTHRILRSVVCTHHRSTDFPPTSLFPGQVIWPSGHGGTYAHQIDEPARVKEARHMARLPDIESEQSKVTTVLRAMSNAKRMRILNELSDGRERSVSELEGVIASLSQSALSQHLDRCDGQTSSAPDANLKPFIIPSMTPMYCGSSGCSAIFIMTIR